MADTAPDTNDGFTLTGSVDKDTANTFRFKMDGEEVRPGVVAPPAVTTLYVNKWAIPGATADSRVELTVRLID